MMYLPIPSTQVKFEIPLELEGMQIRTSKGVHDFLVELADTPDEITRGLMFRRNLPPNQGMLFNLGPEEAVRSFWMKDTYLPLDIIFIDREGQIVSIAKDTEPLSEKRISSLHPALAVLEVNAGTSARLGLKVGDKILHPLFGQNNS